jgi:hypothetical protein
MSHAIREIRRQIQIHRRTRAARTVPYPGPVREAILRLVRERTDAGLSVRSTAEEIGLRAQTLYKWVAYESGTRLRPVAVTGSAEASSELAGIGVVLITPQGYRVEGLNPAALIVLLRGLL